MLKRDVRNEGQALAYLIDCTLATVCDMAAKKRRPKYEFERQVSIAQTGILWALEFGVDLSSTRAADVGRDGVRQWAEQFMLEKRA